MEIIQTGSIANNGINCDQILLKNFTDDRTIITNAIKIGENYIHHETPIGFNTKLLLHQQTVLAAMLDLEKNRTVRGMRDKYCSNNKFIMQTYETCAGILSEKFGSGKTIMVLALIMTNPLPDNKPVYQVCSSTGYKNKHETKSSFFIKKKFRQDLILKPALLFVASSVVLQWKEAISRFTNLKTLVISGVYELRKLYACIKNNTINCYDIVLVKNGSISGEFKTDGYVEMKNRKKQRSIYNMIANITRKLCWSRVVIDDYDIIKLPRPTSFMNGLFTWFISATDALISSNIMDTPEHEDVHDILTYHNINIRSISSLNHLNAAFNVCNDGKYTESSIAVGKPSFWSHKVRNKHKKYVQMIGLMSDGKAVKIMEMLNGDAISTAAEHAGIKSDNIVDIFKKILQNQYDAYSLSVDTIDWIKKIDIDAIGNLEKPIDNDVYYKKHVYKQRPIEYNYPDIVAKITDVHDECVKLKNESGTSIDRVKDNIKDGECPICCSDLSDDNVIIVRCCGKILCADCGIQGSNLVRCGEAISGKCPNCRTIIGFTDFIFLTEEFDLDDIIKGIDIGRENISDEDLAIVEDETKFSILLKIINNEDLPNKKEKTVFIRGMLEGINTLPEAPMEHRKTIVFSKFDESLDCVEKVMVKAGIAYKRLGGTAAQLHAAATEFQESYDGINVLIINGEKYASGLNLHSATNLVFMHKIINTSTESQIIGRLQRLGRVYKAHIHYILYDDEDI